MPALQLATNYLYSARSRKFLYSLVHADRKSVFVEGFGTLEEFDEIDPSLYSSDKMDRIWDQVAANIKWGPFTVPGGFGFTAPYTGNVDLKGTGCYGRASVLCFNRGFTDDIRELYRINKQLSMKMLRIQFTLATALCHEIAHVIECANRHPAIPPGEPTEKCDPFFKDQTTAEVGFSFVNEIFGGNLDGWRPGYTELNIKVTDWPDGIDKGPPGKIAERGPKGPKAPLEVFLGDMKFVQKVFQQEFWDTLAKLPTDEEKSKQLLMPKTVGWCYSRVSDMELAFLPKEQQAEMLAKESRRIVRETKG